MVLRAVSLLVLLVISARTFGGQSVTLTWDANSDGMTAGYYLYTQSDSEAVPGRSDIGQATNATVSNLTEGATYSFYVTAYDNEGRESSPSATVVYLVPSPGGSPIANTPPSVENQAPSASAMNIQGNEDTRIGIPLGGSDPDGDTLTYTVLSNPARGTLSGTAPDLTYTPEPNFHGTDTFTYRVSDGNSTSAEATVTIKVLSVNDAPVASSIVLQVNRNKQVVINLEGSDADGDALSFVIEMPPAHGSLEGTAPALVYTPETNFSGTDSLVYSVSDGNAKSAVATVNINVLAANDPPVADAMSVQTAEDQVMAISLGGTDANGDSLSFSIVASPAHGTLSGTPPNVTYAPASNFHGTDNFTYLVNDGFVDSSLATVVISITPVNDGPVANSMTVQSLQSQSVSLELNGSDADGDELSFSIIVQPAHGSLSGTAPNLLYTPAPEFSGTDSFTFTVSDGTVTSTPGVVTFSIESTANKIKYRRGSALALQKKTGGKPNQ